MNEIIEAIHHDFKNEWKEILTSNIPTPFTKEESELIEARNLAKKLGFSRGNNLSEKLQKRVQEENEKAAIYKAYQHFNFYYPQNKFHTVQSVSKLCDKYGLVMGDLGAYVGNIPISCLQDMDNFKIRDDVCVRRIYSYFHNSYLITESFKIIATRSEMQEVGYSEFVDENGITQIIKEDPIVLHSIEFEKTQYFLVVTAWGLEANDELVKNPLLN